MGGMMGMMALPLRVPNLDAPAALRVGGARGVPGDCPPPSSGAAGGRASSVLAAGQHASGPAASLGPRPGVPATGSVDCHCCVSGRRPGIAAVTVRVGGR